MGSDKPIFDLQVDFEPTYKQVIISMNDEAIKVLIENLKGLLDTGKCGSHCQYDESSGLHGNVDVLVLAKR